MWLTRYSRPTEIMHDQGSEFIGNALRKYLIEKEYRILYKPITLGNTTSNMILEFIPAVIGNLARIYNIEYNCIDKDDPWLGILVATSFVILSNENRLKYYSLGKLVFVCDMILLIKHTSDLELIRQQKLTRINKDKISKNSKIVDHEYKVGDKAMLNNNATFKHENPYFRPFEIIKCWINGMIKLQYDVIKIRYVRHTVTPYTSNAHVEYIRIES